MQTTLGELAKLVDGTLHGDPSTLLRGANPLTDVTSGQITLIDSPQRMAEFESSAAVAAVVPSNAVSSAKPCLAVENIHAAFEKIVLHFRPARKMTHRVIDPTAIVSPSVTLGENVSIGPGCVIGDDVKIGAGSTIHAGVNIAPGCVLGEKVTLYPRVVLYENSVLKDRVVLHAGTVIGSFGFGYHHVQGKHLPSAQLGNVILEADVEVGANTTIDRGSYGPTVIGEGTKIDNLVQIAHNCHIGRHNLICSQVGIAGSSSTGDYVVMAGQVGVRDHVHIGHQAIIGAMAGVSSSVANGAVMLGIPATPEREQKLQIASIAKLPVMRKEFKKLKQVVEQFLEQIERQSSDRATNLPISKQNDATDQDQISSEDAA